MRFNQFNTAKYMPGKVIILVFCCIAVVLFGFCKSASADYCASGKVDVSVYWNVSQGIVGKSLEVKCVDQELFIYLSEEITDAPNGNAAVADSIASLPMAWQSAYGSGITPDSDAGIAARQGQQPTERSASLLLCRSVL